MEYGDAINSDAFRRAVEISTRLHRKEGRSLPEAAKQGVADAYCVCVTDGEDAAEHRFSDVHRKLIEDVMRRLGDGTSNDRS
jgi:hypothetical protein